jgi:hypothetical protein
MFDNTQLDKMIIFTLIGIVIVLTIAVVVLAIKRNVYYVDEEGNEIKPNKKKPAGKDAPHPEAVQPQKMTPLNADPIQETGLETPLAVKGSTVTGAVVMISINGQKTEATINAFPCLMGREKATCNLLISEPAVSRRHAQLIEENGNLYLEDVSEHNGTFINGTKLPPLGRARVHEGDHISLGRAEIDVEKLMY